MIIVTISKTLHGDLNIIDNKSKSLWSRGTKEGGEKRFYAFPKNISSLGECKISQPEFEMFLLIIFAHAVYRYTTYIFNDNN